MGIDDKLRSKNGTTVRYFLTDHLGSTEALTDSTGKVVSSTSYDSFGNATSNIATTYRYTGREYDADTGLYYYRNRWYDPETGRFISKDPIGFASGDINLYGYVGNNPLSLIDPFGFRGCVPSDPPGEDPPLSWWDAFQGALDAVGLTPIVGLPADLLNAGISYTRGNYVDAGLSVSAAVPVAGTFTGLAKLAKNAKKLVKKAFSRGRPPKGVSPRTPVGRKGQHLGGFDPKKPTNYPSKIGNREFSGHAFDKMQSQGITPSAVENAIRKSNSVKGKYKGTTAYHDTVNNMTVITDTASGRVITVSRGIIKQ